MLIRDLHFGDTIAVGKTIIEVIDKHEDAANLSIDGKEVELPFDYIMTMKDTDTGVKVELSAQRKSGRIVRLGISAPRDVKIVQTARH